MFFQLLERALIKGITLITCFFYQFVQKKNAKRFRLAS